MAKANPNPLTNDEVEKEEKNKNNSKPIKNNINIEKNEMNPMSKQIIINEMTVNGTFNLHLTQ